MGHDIKYSPVSPKCALTLYQATAGPDTHENATHQDPPSYLPMISTPGTEDPAQLAAFRQSIAHGENAEFEQVITKPRKKNR